MTPRPGKASYAPGSPRRRRWFLEQQLKYPVDYQVDQKKGVLQVTLQRTPDIKTQTLLGSMETVLYQLAEQCPQDVRIREHGGEMNV